MNKINDFLENEKKEDYFHSLNIKIKEERKNFIVYPPENEVFSCFDKIPEDIKVVILGQDPYHNPEQANGFAFSVDRKLKKLPPSLKNIYKELKSDIEGFEIPEHGDLTCWANQGVLLLNTALTVRKNQPASHSKIGWEIFTDNLISFLNNEYDGLVFILWGKHAQNKCKHLNEDKHFIIKSAHPSPFSARNGFFDSKPFSKTNEYLFNNNKKIINWNIV